jgi:hypothetical protein
MDLACLSANYQAPGHPALEPLAKMLQDKQVLARLEQFLFPAELATHPMLLICL